MGHGNINENKGQHRKNNRLDESGEHFNSHKRNRGNEGNKAKNHDQKDIARKNITKKTKRKGENLHKFTDQLKKADKKHNGVGKIEKLTQIIFHTDIFNRNELREANRNESDGQSHIQITVGRAE